MSLKSFVLFVVTQIKKTFRLIIATAYKIPLYSLRFSISFYELSCNPFITAHKKFE